MRCGSGSLLHEALGGGFGCWFLVLLVPSLSSVQLGPLFDILRHEVVDSWESDLELGAVTPFFHLVEHESFTILDGILAVQAADHLHRPGRGGVVKVDDGYTSWQRLRWLEVVTIVYIWEGFHEVKHVSCIRVRLLGILVAQEVVVCIVLVIPSC